MRQILHIFRKDVRHFWPEVFVVLALSLSFGLVVPHSWPTSTSFDEPVPGFHLNFRQWSILTNTIAVLLPVSWLVLIVRVVHAENLIGTRHLWITRPYLWPSLLAEKMLLLSLCTLVPFAAAQVMLLHHVGFWARDYLPGLGYCALIMLGIAVLPFFALASVVSTLVRVFGVLLTITALVLGAAFLASTFHSESRPEAYTPYRDVFSLPAIVVLCLAVLLIQYSSRKLWLARALLIAVPSTLLLLFTEPFKAQLFQHSYPALPSGPSILHVQLTDEGATQYTAGAEDRGLLLTFDVSGLAPKTALAAENLRVGIDAADGSKYDTGWQATYGNERVLAPGGRSRLGVQVDRAFLDRHTHDTLTLHIELAFTQLVAGTSATVHAPGGMGTYSVPGLGICSDPYAGISGTACRTAFRPPQLSLVTRLVQPAPCSATTGAQAIPASAWVGSSYSDPAEISFIPVQNTFINFTPASELPVGDRAVACTVCAGGPVTITPYSVLRRFSYRFVQRGVGLSEYLPPARTIR